MSEKITSAEDFYNEQVARTEADMNPGVRSSGHRPKVLSLTESRQGHILAYVSNRPAPLVMEDGAIYDVLLDLELMGYDIANELKKQKQKEALKRPKP